MIRINCDFRSDALEMATTMTVLIPPACGKQAERRSTADRPAYPVLYLLHGLSDDETTWQRSTSIERYAEACPFVIIMPRACRSFYSDEVGGAKYWTFLTEELPALISAMLPVSTARVDTYAAGLSMGGYGAFKLGLRYPDRFAAVASLSGSLDIRHRLNAWPPELQAEFGPFVKNENDLLYLIRKLASSSIPLPRFYQCCGTEDFLYEDNHNFLKVAREHRLDITYEEAPGVHEWGFWDRMIQKVLAWLMAMRPAGNAIPGTK